MNDIGRRASLGEALDAAAGELERAGLRDPRREATALWGALQGLGPGEVWRRRDTPAAPEQSQRFWDAVQRRSSGVPFAYVVGRVPFRTLDLGIDPRALIPRPETEGLVELVLDWLATRETRDERRETGGVAADIGTGSGCIALSLAVEANLERVIAVDAAVDAAALTRENIALVRPSTPVEVRVGDLLAPLAGERCQVIVSNPPYLTEAEYTALDPSVRQFEPRMALASGADGLAATRVLLDGARAVLEPDGLLALEIDERRGEVVRRLARDAGWTNVAIHQDLFGRPRYALVTDRD